MPLNHLPYYLANILIHTSVCIFFILYSCSSKLRFSIRTTVLMASVYIAISCVIVLLFYEQEAPYPQYVGIASFVWIIISIIACLIIIKAVFIHAVFLIFVAFNIQDSIILISKTIISFDIFPHIFTFEHANYLLTTVVVLILYLPIMWYIYIHLHKKVIEVSPDFKYLQYLCMLPISFFALIHTGPFWNASQLITYGSGSIISLLLLNMVGISAYIISLEMLLKTCETMTAKEQMHLMARQLEMQKGEYERLFETNTITARQRHDWRQHLLAIRGLVQTKNYSALERYLREYMEDFMADDIAPLCKNTVVDVILRHFITLAKEKGIEVITDVNVPVGVNLSDLDLCVVFGNLIENAVEACTLQKNSRKFIKIKAATAGEQLLIFIQNSFFTAPVQANGGFLSSKHDGEGIGISSVKNIVDTNGGTMLITIEDNVFTVDVLLNV